MSKAPIPVAEEPLNLNTRTDQGWGPASCVDCGGPPLERPETLFPYDPPCEIDCETWFPSEATDQARDLAVPDDAFSVKTKREEISRKATYASPKFPKVCIKKRASGAVIVEYDVTPEGAAANVRIIKTADKCFNAEAIRFVSTYRFRPQTDEYGRAVWRRDARKTINFEFSV